MRMDSYAEASRKSKNRRKLDRRQIRIAARGAQERRRFRRVELSMPGRYLDRVRGEFPCTLVDISVTGAAFKCEERPRIGERVHVGDMVGRVARWLDTGFAVAFDPPSVEREARSA
jgi:hypothetical protein